MPGKISLSAIKGRNCVAVRPSGRIGGNEESEEERYDSSAGERRICWLDGAIVRLVCAARSGCVRMRVSRYVVRLLSCGIERSSHLKLAGYFLKLVLMLV